MISKLYLCKLNYIHIYDLITFQINDMKENIFLKLIFHIFFSDLFDFKITTLSFLSI